MSKIEQTVIARAPVRVDPGGGGTDAPPFCDEYGGNVVNFGITRYVHASLDVLADKREVELHSVNLGAPLRAASVDALRLDGTLDLLKGIAKRMNPPWGFRLQVHADVPPGSGLGSSGALGAACVGAFLHALGKEVEPHAVATLANDIERGDLGYAGGCQDSFGTALGGFHLIEIHRDGQVTAADVKLPGDLRYELERRFLLVHTGQVHLSGSIHDDIKADYALEESTTRDAMHKLSRVALDMRDVIERGDIQAFGALLDENWVHHKRLHASCTSPLLEGYYEAMAGLVDGGKTCGAGGGGCILFLTKDGEKYRALERCKELGGEILPLTFDFEGLRTWNILPG